VPELCVCPLFDDELGTLCAALQVVLYGLAATLPWSGPLHAYVEVFLSWQSPMLLSIELCWHVFGAYFRLNCIQFGCYLARSC